MIDVFKLPTPDSVKTLLRVVGVPVVPEASPALLRQSGIVRMPEAAAFLIPPPPPRRTVVVEQHLHINIVAGNVHV